MIRKHLYSACTTLLLFNSTFAQSIIADFGLEADYTWANRTQYNYGFGGREETATRFSADIGGFAQANWDLLEVLDLSSHGTQPITLLGTLDNASGEAFRVFIYDALGNLASVEFKEGFVGGTYLSQNQWNTYAWDAFGGKGTGSFDWSAVKAIGFRTNSQGVVRFEIDKLVLGEVTIPDPGGGGGGGGGGETPDPIPEPWTFIPPVPFSGSTMLESVSVSEGLSVEDHLLNASDWSTPTASHYGVIFYAYIDLDQDISVMARHPDGSEETAKVMLGIADDNHHVEPSLGIDSHGFLHLVGDMHNQMMKYYRSVRPMDLSDWEFLGSDLATGGIEGASVTYPSFFNAPDGTLFVAFRSGVYPAWIQGRQAGAIGRYDVETGLWTMLGGIVQKWTPEQQSVGNVVIWDDSGSGDNRGYQGYKLRCAFSPSGRLHMSWNIARNPDPAGTFGISANHTHVMYAYSDDKGDTWHHADGTQVIPPMGTHNMSPVYVSTEESLYNNTAIAFTSDDRGIVGQKDNSTDAMRWWVWDGQEWTGFPNKSTGLPGLIAPGPYGSLNAFDETGLHRSWDNGLTWKVYKIPAPTSAYETYADLNYFRKTGRLRYSHNAGDAGIVTVEFSGAPVPVGGPLAIAGFNPPMAAFGRPYAHALPAGGGDGTYQFSITGGSLPAGLVLNVNGTMSGVAAEMGDFPCTIRVEDGSGSTDERDFTLQVASFANLPIRNITATDSLSGFPAELAADGRLDTRWATNLSGSKLLLDLGKPVVVDLLLVNWAGSTSRTYAFLVEVSNDGDSWSSAFHGSSWLGADSQSYPLTTLEPVRYLRITGNGSSFDDRTNINEISVQQKAQKHLTPWPQAIHANAGWKWTWLGWIQDSAYPYVYSDDHGWLYTVMTGTEAAWFYSYEDQLGWFYTGSLYYTVPGGANLYHAELGWLYYYANTRPRWFHRFSTGEDFSLPLP